jgi:hypothetical protein
VTDIFSEVEEDVRKERWEQLWKRYGVYVIGVATAVIVGVVGWQAWENYELAGRQEASVRFNTAQNAFDTGDLPMAETEFAAIAAEAPAGYADLAEFQRATAQLAQGKRDEAITSLRAIVDGNDPLLSPPARLQLAWLLAEAAPRAEVDEVIAPLLGAQSPWRFPAAEVGAYLDFRDGDREAAAASYQALAVDPGVSDGLRQRAGAIAQFLRANEAQATNAIEPGETQNPDGAATPAAEPVQEVAP